MFIRAFVHEDCPSAIVRWLKVVRVRFLTLDGEEEHGRIVLDRRLAADVENVFELAFRLRYPIHSVVPINVYDWDDDLSMSANNSSGHNYRFIAGTTELSFHAYGMAIDINPLWNPMVLHGKMFPACGIQNPDHPGTLTADHPIVLRFKELGWTCGIDWQEPFDPHHFQKDVRAAI
ncbi:M15 family metallopeptidase [Candidatus Uhrbacteria bacterium]|jgi:peptidoglycan LD-endopeptidase CwlK|nr:M15 family metallopeptidase [Candidatus Uhrbacteria bacterium]